MEPSTSEIQAAARAAAGVPPEEPPEEKYPHHPPVVAPKGLPKGAPQKIKEDAEANLSLLDDYIKRQQRLSQPQDALGDALGDALANPLGDQQGSGHSSGGQYDDQLNKMALAKKVPNFLGTIASDEIIKLLPKIKPNSKCSFIMNLSDSHEKGTHWVSCVLNGTAHAPDPHSIMYFDSFGIVPSNKTLQQLKPLADKLDPNTIMKLKVNRVQHQTNDSSTCGFHALNFILDTVSRGQTFANASGFNDHIKNESSKYEPKIERMEKQKPFSYIIGDH